MARELTKESEKLNFIFVGSTIGPEREMVKEFTAQEMKFLTITSGKWRRYFSLANFLDIFKIIIAFFESIRLLKNNKADLVISAGSFISVPLVWAAYCMKIPILIHQQDLRPGLANKLMAPFARVITISFEKSFIDYGPRAIWTGNPLKDTSVYLENKIITQKKYNLEIDLPLVLVIGGGTGSVAINELVYQALPDLLKMSQVVHLTGKGKKSNNQIINKRYQSFEFLAQEEVLALMAAADLVVSRCGLGVLTELANLKKIALLIPIPRSHQEDNAAVFRDNRAAVVLDQERIGAADFNNEIRNLLSDQNERDILMNNIGKIMKTRAAENISAIIWELLASRSS